MSDSATEDKKTVEQAKADVTAAVDNIKTDIVEVEHDGYKFKVDTGMIDDVDVLDLIDKIENQNNMKAIVDLLEYLIGVEGYKQMKAYFVKKEGRFRISTLSKIYVAIFEKFDPKD